MNSKKMRYNYWRRLFLGLLSLITVAFLIYKMHEFDLKDTFNEIGYSICWNNPLVILTLVLPFFTLTIEVIKWRTLLPKTHSITFFVGYLSILRGISTGLFTPARLGEIFGRLVYVRDDNMQATSAFFVGSFLQTAVTALGAVVAFIFAPIVFNALPLFFVYAFLLFAVLILGLLWSIKRVKSDFLKKKIGHIKHYFRCLEVEDVVRATLLSMLKFLFYSLQLIILLLLFNRGVEVGEMVPLVFLFFAGITFLPGFLLVDLGIRGSLALVLFHSACYTPPGVLLATYILWVVNSAIPALLGLILGWLPTK